MSDLTTWDGARAILERRRAEIAPRCARLWGYYSNEDPTPTPFPSAAAIAAGPARRGYQERGLPRRITGARGGPRREVVVENDIAWRLQTMVDFLFGGPIRVLSTAGDPAARSTAERLLDAVWEASGGIALLQDAALLGHVHGWVDFVVRVDEVALLQMADRRGAEGRGEGTDEERTRRVASAIRIEVVEPTRGAPVMSARDYRVLDGYVLELGSAEASGRQDSETPGWRERAVGWARRSQQASRAPASPAPSAVLEALTPGVRTLFSAGRVIAREESRLLPGVLPVVHVQNLSVPFAYAGQSEVEPLIGLQDELNTRLSDRAHRVAMQSFRMYLARGLEGFGELPVAPGQVWSTDNPNASIESFGGDASSPSEERHVTELREAMDKLSGVPPLAGGVVQGRIGNLSSGTALRVTLMALLGKTARKRVTYGAGIERVSRIVLDALAAAGLLPLRESDRGVRVRWPEVLAVDEEERIRVARGKLEVGVPPDVVLAELGYGHADAGVA